MSARVEQGRVAVLDSGGAEFIEPGHLGARPFLVGELVVGPATPQRQCVVEAPPRFLMVVARSRHAAVGDEIFESGRVQLVSLHAQPIAIARRFDPTSVVAQRRPQAVNVGAHVVVCPLGRITVRPHRVDEPID